MFVASRRLHTLPRLTLLAALLWGAWVAQSAALEPTTFEAFPHYAQGWKDSQDGFKPARTLTQGVLANGVRYVLVPSKQEPGHASIRLLVEAGALMETDDEAGMAHYLEHMAFNGSNRLPEGTLHDFFTQNGMHWGRDANAVTTPVNTVYKLNLNQTDKATLSAAMTILSDWAGGLTLSQTAVEKERGIILAEKRERDTQRNRLHALEEGLLYQDRRARPAIGSLETLNAVTSSSLKAFYERWYRPNRLVVVVVGDVDTKTVKGLIQKEFAGLKARGPEPQRVTLRSGVDTVKAAVVLRAGVPYETLTVTKRLARVDLTDDMRLAKRMMADRFLEHLLEAKLNDSLDPKSNGALNRVRVEVRTTDSLYPVVHLQVTVKAGESLATLARMKRDLLAVLSTVPSARELNTFKKTASNTGTCTDASVVSANERLDSAADRLVRELSAGFTLMTPCERHQVLTRAVNDLTTVDLQDLWSRVNAPNTTGLLLVSPSEIDKTVLTQTWETGAVPAGLKATDQANAQTPESAQKNGTTAHTVTLTPITEKRPLTVKPVIETVAPGRFKAVFANGLTLWMEQVSSKSGPTSVTLYLEAPCSPLSKSEDRWMAHQVLAKSGVAGWARADYEKALEKRNLHVNLKLDRYGLGVHGSVKTSDSQTLAGILTELKRWTVAPNWATVEDAPSIPLANTPKAQFSRAWRAFVTGEDTNKAQTQAALHACLKEATQAPTRHIVVSGAFDVNAVLNAVHQTFGAKAQTQDTPSARELSRQTQKPSPFPSGEKKTLTVKTDGTAAMVGMSWVLDQKDAHMALKTLAPWVRLTLMESTREKDSLVYSPQVMVTSLEDVVPGRIAFSINAQCDVKDVNRFIASIEKTTNTWKTKGLAEDVYTANKPYVERARIGMMHPHWRWIADVMEHEGKPYTATVPTTAKALNELAKTLFTAPPAILVVTPSGTH